MPELTHFALTDPNEDILTAIETDGACILDELIPVQRCDRLMADFKPHIDAAPWNNTETDDLEEVVARAENILTREAIRRGGKPSQRPRGVTGQIENLPLPDIVQILSIGMKTACVTLTAGKRQGKIWFRDGALGHANAGVGEGEEAFFEMLDWNEGTFEIRHGVRTDKKTVDNDAMFLVMEGLRRIDEASANL